MASSKIKIGAKIFLGVLLWLTTLIILWVVTEDFITLLNKDVIVVDITWLLIMFFYRTAYVWIGWFIAAKVAKEKPFTAAGILGGIIAFVYFYELYIFWNQGINTELIILGITWFITPYAWAYIAAGDKKIFLWKSLLKKIKRWEKIQEIKEENTIPLATKSIREEVSVVKSAPKEPKKEVLPKRNTWKTEEIKKPTKKEEVKTSKTPTKSKKETPKEVKTTKVSPKKPQTKKPTPKKTNA